MDIVSNPFGEFMKLFEGATQAIEAVLSFLMLKIEFSWFHDLPQIVQTIIRILAPGWWFVPSDSITILGLMLSGGIMTFLMFTIIKWVLDMFF